MYKNKYLKYKKKYIKLKNQIGGNYCDIIQCATIQKGEILFRVSENICNINTNEKIKENKRYCNDTEKTGLYFATKAIISLSMCLEYKKLSDIAIFRVKEDINNVSIGKYSFRNLILKRLNNKNKTNLDLEKDIKIILKEPITQEENIDHIGPGIIPLEKVSSDNLNYFLPEHILDGLNCLGNHEIFLTEKSLDKIEFIESYTFNKNIIKNANDLFEYMKKNHFPYDIDFYIKNNILIKNEKYLY